MKVDHTTLAFTRRGVLLSAFGAAGMSHPAWALNAEEITWEDLIPPGVPYSEIIGEGEMDVVNDTWNPIYDANGVKLNEALDDAYVRIPGFIIPLQTAVDGVDTFLLVPYVGACIHVPPPPANQLVYVTASKAWPADQLWDPVWVTGRMSTRLQSTELGETGYELTADLMEIYEW